MRLSILALVLWFATGLVARADDDRIAVTLPPEIKTQFMAEMRSHTETLDDIIAAIGSADFREAANIADIKLDFGHRMWERMADQGMSPEEIAEMKKKMRRAGMAMGSGAGHGMGRFMPSDCRPADFIFRETAESERRLDPAGQRSPLFYRAVHDTGCTGLRPDSIFLV